MTWFFIALLGPLLWSVCNQIDRYFLKRYFAHETLGALLMFSSLIGIVVLPVAWVFFDPFGGYSVGQAALLLGAGLASVCGIYLYLMFPPWPSRRRNNSGASTASVRMADMAEAAGRLRSAKLRWAILLPIICPSVPPTRSGTT